MRRGGLLVSAPLALLLLVFIAWPIASVLVASFRLDGPLPYASLRQITQDAMAHLAPEERAGLLARWARQANPEQRIEATATALTWLGKPPAWDRTASFADQAEAAQRAVAALPPGVAFEPEFALATAALHRRSALAFRVRDALGEAGFERLRTGTATGWGLDHYLAVVTDARMRAAMLASLAIALPVALAVTLLGFLVAWAVQRGVVPGWTRWLMLAPIVAPPVLLSLALVLLFGRAGVVTHTLLDQALGLIDSGQTNIYGPIGIGLAQVLGTLPAAFIVLDSALSRHDPRAEEAAAATGATPWQVFARVTLPGAEPGLVRAFLLSFVLSMTDFGNPEVIGDNKPTLAGLVYDEAFGFQNFPLAAALCVWLILPAALLQAGLALARRNRRFHSQAIGAGAPDLPLPAAPRLLARATVALLGGAIVLLYGVVAAGAFVRSWGFDWTPTLMHFLPQADSYAGSAASRGMASVLRTAEIVGLAAPLGGVLGVLAAHVVDRLRPPGAGALGFLVLLPAIVPGLVFGIGYVLAFNAPFGINALSLSGTRAALVLNIGFDKMFVAFLAARAALARSDPALDDAASSLGAKAWRRFTMVTLPLLRHALLLGMLYVFIDGTTTLSAIIFLVGPDTQLAAVRIFGHASSARYGLAAALSLVLMGLVLIAMLLAASLQGERLRPRERP
jgi:iron(III) transport system permease protein